MHRAKGSAENRPFSWGNGFLGLKNYGDGAAYSCVSFSEAGIRELSENPASVIALFIIFSS
jgi:hypothetical protein